MSQLCAITKCNRTSRGLCDCCTQNLCLQHLNEHNASLISRLNPLTDEINALGDRLKRMNIQKVAGGCHRKLEQWRVDCHQKIDSFFQVKCKELDRLVDAKLKKQQMEIVQIQSKVADLIREQETTRQDIDSLTSTIRQLEKNMDKIEQTCFTITTRPLLIDDALVFIKATTGHELDLSTLSPIYKTINVPAESKRVISSNDRFLLMHQMPNLCFVDQEMNIVKEILWTDNRIYNMCWSSTLDRFIVIGEKHIFLVDEKTNAINKVQTIEERDWLSCTCSETFLFLSTNETASSIMKYSLLLSLKFAMEWKSPHTCAENEFINDIVCNDGTLGVLIKNRSEKSLRMELRYAEIFDCIWSLRFDTVWSQNRRFSCCLLTCDEWLVADYETKRLLHITKDGKLKNMIQQDDTPYRVNRFANMLVTSRNGGISFHKL